MSSGTSFYERKAAPPFGMNLKNRFFSQPFLDNLAILTFFFSLFFFHLSTLESHLLDGNEVTLADFAFHGRLELWKNIVPASYKPMEVICGLGSSPLYFFVIAILKSTFKLVGVHIWSLRLASCLGGLLGLAFFCSMLSHWFGKRAYLFLLLGFTQVFFCVTHSARPEGLILFIGMINLWWAFKRKGVPLGLVSGVFFGLSGGIHPEIILFAIPMLQSVYLQFQSGELRKKEIAWWAIGGIIGAATVFYFADLNLASTYSRENYGRGKAFVLPFIYWKWNLVGLIDNGVENLTNTLSFWKNPFWAFLWTLFLVSTLYCCLYFKEFAKSKKNMILVCCAFLLAYFLFNGSPTKVYQVFLLPWVSFSAVLFLNDLFRRKVFTNSAVLFLSLVGIYSLTKSVCMPLFLFSIPIFLRIILPNLSIKSGFVFLAALVFMAIFNMDTVYYAYSYAERYVSLRPLWMLFIFLWPWLFMRSGRMQWEFRFPSRWASGRLLFFYFSVGLIVWAGYEIRGLFRDQLISNAYSERVSKLIASISHEPRILGPGVWWVTNPNLAIRDTYNLSVYLDNEPNTNPIDSFLSYRPTKAYWPVDRKELLNTVNERLKKPIFNFKEEFDLPAGKWVEVVCNYDLIQQTRRR